jgi:hypothetical protein
VTTTAQLAFATTKLGLLQQQLLTSLNTHVGKEAPTDAENAALISLNARRDAADSVHSTLQRKLAYLQGEQAKAISKLQSANTELSAAEMVRPPSPPLHV